MPEGGLDPPPPTVIEPAPVAVMTNSAALVVIVARIVGLSATVELSADVTDKLSEVAIPL
jgi:hypothetical protein